MDRLNRAFLHVDQSIALKKRFARLGAEARQKALERVKEPGYRNWLQNTSSKPPEPDEALQPQIAHYTHTRAGENEPYSTEALEALYQRGQAMWKDALAQRRNMYLYASIYIYRGVSIHGS